MSSTRWACRAIRTELLRRHAAGAPRADRDKPIRFATAADVTPLHALIESGCSLGMLCVAPRRQSGGAGKRLITAAERTAVERFGAERMEMTVIDRRPELIAFYQRRGYVPTGERRAFPVPVVSS
jgi:GNAT superfamily N-acetyltransferase